MLKSRASKREHGQRPDQRTEATNKTQRSKVASQSNKNNLQIACSPIPSWLRNRSHHFAFDNHPVTTRERSDS